MEAEGVKMEEHKEINNRELSMKARLALLQEMRKQGRLPSHEELKKLTKGNVEILKAVEPLF